jgi:type I restriction enzyme S subunit
MGTQLNLNSDTVGMIHFPVPPLSEQEHIVSYLDEKTSQIDKTIDIEKKKIELLKEYRQSLISNVVTGKIKVTE